MAHLAYMNWSGGKDSAMALYKVLQNDEYEVRTLLTTVSEAFGRVSMHGVREVLLNRQSSRIGIPVRKLYLPETVDMNAYNALMMRTVEKLKIQELTHSIFGDIFLEDLREYREERMKECGMTAVFPLWGRNTRELLLEGIDAGFKSVIVCVNAHYLDESFVGREIDRDFLNSLPANVDPCGENGEFHSFVYDGPIFNTPVHFLPGEKTRREYATQTQRGPDTAFWYMDLLP